MNFPTLSRSPSMEGFKEEAAFDPTLRSEFESGKIQTRARCTSAPIKWSITYRYLPDADKETLQTFEKVDVRYGAASFNWTDPNDKEIHEVRFAKPISYALDNNQPHKWCVQIELIEV